MAAEGDDAGDGHHDEQNGKVGQAFGDDGAQRAADRRAAPSLKQVAAVGVAEFGGNDAVDEPGEEQDLHRSPVAGHRVALFLTDARLSEHPTPADGAGKKRQVVKAGGDRIKTEIGMADVLPDLVGINFEASDKEDDRVWTKQLGAERGGRLASVTRRTFSRLTRVG